ncbi:Protein kinase domain-containing protein [Heracleum sosnowskyi]|uniref:non-specific serine/threonine protein kinase n=1 Tax=Heracleum sosnowskyi TaxID=360622 RepID=A0AAD8HQR9_9APIA|nr:Protein kinase domain-containing protein [Heracleum sosnowskyi]
MNLDKLFVFFVDRDYKNKIMGKTNACLALIFCLITFISSADSSCPINFDYVERFPWNTSLCSEPMAENCCQTIEGLLGLGLSKHLKDTSLFYLPNPDAASSCLMNFWSKLASMNLFPACQNMTNDLVVNPSNCAGIARTLDWDDKVGSSSELDLSCGSDFIGLTQCGSCLDAVKKVSSKLTSFNRNSTKCYDYTRLYAAGNVIKDVRKNIRAAACIFGLALSNSANSTGSEGMSKTKILKIGFGLSSALFGGLAAGVVIIIHRKSKLTRAQNALREEYVRGVKAKVLPNTGAKWFSIGELEKATGGFSQRNLIGQGGYGVVYKGVLLDGTVVAIKQLLDMDTNGDDVDFTNEAEIISKIRHRNLLVLRGFCVTSDAIRGNRRFLVYDFMSNGSLHEYLFNSRSISKGKGLDWPMRKNIILDVAKGLEYLHYGIKPAIYHRDIKSTNILLDSDMKARVADFGLAKQNTEGQSHFTTRVAGTYGYLAPEYALYGQLTEKSDVYSFGIIVLEILSGRKVLGTSDSSTVLITDWAWDHVKSGNVDEIFDPTVREDGAKMVMERFVHVGILCAHVMVAHRPTISNALKMLEGDIDIPRLPERPLPLGHESFRL